MEAFIQMATFLLSASLRQAAPLSLAGLGVAYAEKAGILNIGEEAIMLSGAFFGFLTAFYTGNLFLGVLGGIAGGVLISMIHGFFSIHGKANQTIVGLALNFFSLGLTSFLFLLAFRSSSTLPNINSLKSIAIPFLSSIPIIGPAFFNQNVLVYMLYIAIVLLMLVFYKTEWGTRLVAVGENPRAADSVGIDVFNTRYFACLVNGILGGLGGCYITLAQLGYFQEDIISGKGYISLVVVILGRHNPVFILLSAMIIGLSESLQFSLQAMGIPLPSQAFSMFPYVVAVIVLLFSIGKRTSPAALGRPYERESR